MRTPLPSLPGHWDEARLERALLNVIGNAVKYSPDGGDVTIAVALDSGAEPPQATVRVTDHGIGIPASDLQRVFEAYYRAPNAGHTIPGSGLGLFTVRHIVTRHGGTVEVESQEGQGTAVSLRLPLRAPSAPPRLLPSPPPRGTLRATMIVYVGSYTGPERASGISVFRQDPASGDLAPLGSGVPTDNPSFLALHPRLPVLYAVNETAPEESPGPGVSAFAVDPSEGRLTPLNRQPAHGTSPCYVSLDPQGRYVLVANYGDGTVAVFPVQPDGSLGEATDVVRHKGSGPHARRQQGPHAHSVQFDPQGTFVLVCDLGIDQVLTYRLDPDAGKLRPHDPPAASVLPAGAPATWPSILPAASPTSTPRSPPPSTSSPTIPERGVLRAAADRLHAPPGLRRQRPQLHRPGEGAPLGEVRLRLQPWPRQHRPLRRR